MSHTYLSPRHDTVTKTNGAEVKPAPFQFTWLMMSTCFPFANFHTVCGKLAIQMLKTCWSRAFLKAPKPCTDAAGGPGNWGLLIPASWSHWQGPPCRRGYLSFLSRGHLVLSIVAIAQIQGGNLPVKLRWIRVSHHQWAAARDTFEN